MIMEVLTTKPQKTIIWPEIEIESMNILEGGRV